MNQFLNQIKAQFKKGSMNLKLIMVNIGFFIVIILFSIIIRSFVNTFSLVEYIGVSSNFGTMILKPWTIITHQFFHIGLSHLFWNMMVLYFAGNFFVNRLGNKKLLSLYLIGGFFGYLIASLGYSFLPTLVNQTKGVGVTMFGASASISAILVAIGFYAPNTPIQIPFIKKTFKLLHLVLVIVALDFIRLNNNLAGLDVSKSGWLAHIGGSFFGYFYATFLLKGKNILKGFEKFLDSFFNIVKGNYKFKSSKKKFKVKNGGKTKHTKPPKDDYEYNAQKKERQDRIDAILDKISKSGYESLTKKEKDFLFSQSKK